VSTEPVTRDATPRERAYRQAAESLESLANALRLMAVADEPKLRAVPAPEKDRLLTRAEVGERLGMKPSWVRTALGNGTLAGVKVASVWRVKESELDAYIRRCERAGRPK